MTGREIANLTMVRTVYDICGNYTSTILTNKAFNNAYSELGTKIEVIVDTAKQQGVVITGIAADKNVDREDLAKAAANVAGNIFAYADRIKNNTLKESVNFSYTDILRLKGDLLTTRANDIYDIANENLAVLADSNISADSQAVYLAKIEKYKASVLSPRTATSTKSTKTNLVNKLVKEVVLFLTNQLDKLIVNFEGTNDEFVAAYHNARKVIKLGGGKKKTTPKKDEPKQPE